LGTKIFAMIPTGRSDHPLPCTPPPPVNSSARGRINAKRRCPHRDTMKTTPDLSGRQATDHCPFFFFPPYLLRWPGDAAKKTCRRRFGFPRSVGTRRVALSTHVLRPPHAPPPGAPIDPPPSLLCSLREGLAFSGCCEKLTSVGLERESLGRLVRCACCFLLA